MTQFGCICGHQLSDNTDRLPYKAYLLPDEDVDLVIANQLDPFEREMYECENCGRLWIRAAPRKNKWVPYLPETAARGILRHEGVTTDE